MSTTLTTGADRAPPAGRIRTFMRRMVSPGGSLSGRIVRGGIWAFSMRAADRLLKLVRTLILARLLGPDDYGVFGIALVAMSALETFSQTGFQQALIQKKDTISAYLATAWTVGAGRGLVLGAILAGAAPLVADFYGKPEACAIIQAISLSFVFQGFTNIGVIYFQKELEFHRQFAYVFAGTVFDLGVSIAAAVAFRDAWALVLGVLAGDFVRMATSYAIHPYRPRLAFSLKRFRELSSFGRWVLGSSILLFLLNSAPPALAGKVIDVAALGALALATRLSGLPATEITQVISIVSFPAYAKLQDDPERLRSAYARILQLTAFVSVPIAALVFCLTPPFVALFLDAEWMGMIPAMQILAIWGLLRSLGATMGPVFQAVGKPWLTTKLVFMQVAVLAALIYPFTARWNILGTAAALTLSSFIPALAGAFAVVRVTGCGVRQLATAAVYPIIATAPMAAVLLWCAAASDHPITLAGFLLLGAGGLVLYGGGCLLLDRFCGYGIAAGLRKVVSRI